MAWYLTPTPGNAGAKGPRVPVMPKPPKVKLPPRPTLHLPARPAPGPFDPLTDAQLQGQAQTSVQALMGPIIQQIRDAYAARSSQGEAAIGTLTNALGGLLAHAGPATAAAYGEARTADTATNNALANRLASFGGNLAGEQGQQLASINAPASVGNVTAQAGTAATGAANAGFAKGSAELEALNAHGAAAGAMAAQLPGIAALTGIQNGRQLEAQLNHEMGAALTQAAADAARQVGAIYDHLKDVELQKAMYVKTYGLKSGQQRYDQALALAKLQLQRQTAVWTRQARAATNAVARQNAGTTASRAAEAARNNRARARIAQQNANTNAWRAHNPKGGKAVGTPRILRKKH